MCVTHAYVHPLRWRTDHYPIQCMGYNVPGRKLNRGLSGVDSVAILKDRELRNSEYFQTDRPQQDRRMVPSLLSPSTTTPRLCHVVPARKRLQAYFLVSGDLTSLGRPCWYRVDGVGMVAANDALISEGAMFQIISGRDRFMLTSWMLCMKYVQ